MKSFLGNGIQISIITNGQRLCGDSANILKDAKWVRISIDSVNSDMYSKIRGVSLQAFDEVCNNIKEFSKIKNSDCELGINFVISKENADSVYEAAALFKGLGANHIKFTARITENVGEYHETIKQNVIEK
jgi:molybdenum cofactor biosynthesis enzyme MoaA